MKKKTRIAAKLLSRRTLLIAGVAAANVVVLLVGAGVLVASMTVNGPRCGDGVRDIHEQCDDGNSRNGDGCSYRCTEESRCGNGRLDRGESCDDRNRISNDGCSAICRLEICGDGVLQENGADGIPNTRDDEQCDDGNRNIKDDCPNTCRLTNCGDDSVQKGEECDDGNVDSGDGCSAACRREQRCIPGMSGCVPTGSTVNR